MFVNFLQNGLAKVSPFADEKAVRHIEANKTTTLKLGSVCGVEKEYPVSVQYVLDEHTNKLILISTSNYGNRYSPLIGRIFDSVQTMRVACLRLYTPPYLD